MQKKRNGGGERDEAIQILEQAFSFDKRDNRWRLLTSLFYWQSIFLRT